MSVHRKNGMPPKWGAMITLLIQSENVMGAKTDAATLLIPIIRKAARDAGVNLISPLPSEPYMVGGVSNPALGTTTRTSEQHVIFQELSNPKHEGWRVATDWLFQALENVSSETIEIVSITETRIGA